MKKFGIAILILAGIIGFLSWGYGYEFNARVTVSVQTPDGVKTGSSVVSFKIRTANEAWEPLRVIDSGSALIYKGEAVVVELGHKNYLFVLLNEKNIHNLSMEMFFKDIYAKDNVTDRGLMGLVQSRIDKIKRLRDAKPIPPVMYPYFVKFDDIANAQKVIKVDPNGMSATLGPGYALQSITMAITDEPLTKGNVTAALGAGFFNRWDELKFFQSEARTTYEYKVFQNRISELDFVQGVQ